MTPNGDNRAEEKAEVKARGGSIRGEARNEVGVTIRIEPDANERGLFSFEMALGVGQALAFAVGFEDVDAVGQPVEHGLGKPFAA